MIRRPPRSTRTDTLFPYTTLFRSQSARAFWAYVDGVCEDEDLGAASFLEQRHRRHFYFGAGDGRKADFMHFRQCELRSEEHTSELQSLMRISYAVFCLKKKKQERHRMHHK